MIPSVGGNWFGSLCLLVGDGITETSDTSDPKLKWIPSREALEEVYICQGRSTPIISIQ